MRKRPNLLWAFLGFICFSSTLSAADSVIRGVVTDSSGKPIRGAIIKARLGDKEVSRLSQKDGHYAITLPDGTYDLSVDAYGFPLKRLSKDTAQAGDANFVLSAKFDVSRLSSAELESLLPDNEQGRLLRASCLGCHSFATVMLRRGSTAAEWAGFLPTMTRGRMNNPRFDAPRLAAISQALEKFFGPDAAYLGPNADSPKMEQVKHTDVSDAALNATIREYTIPSPGAMSHSIMVDSNDIAWFSEYDYQSNAVGRFDPKTEKFQEYRIPIPKAAPHTGVVGKDGRIWMSLAGGVGAQLASVDPATSEVKTYVFGEGYRSSHTLAIDPIGNVWTSGASNGVFDVKTEKFKGYALPPAGKYPEDTLGAWSTVPGEEEARGANGTGSYDVRADSQGRVWFTQEAAGRLVSLDQETGATKTYRIPGMVSVKGVTVDQKGTVWFANFQGHQLGKMDPKTGAIKMFHLPTANGSPYGLAEDVRTGYIWFADMNGDHITRFDPKTEKFIEYPVPTHLAYPRFIGIDSKSRVWFTEFMQPKIGVIDPGDSSKQLGASR